MDRQKLAIAFIIFSILFGKIASAQPRKIWIDTDISMGKLGRDVDDGIALIMALRSEAVSVRGISLVFGNSSDMDYAYEVTQGLLRWYQQDGEPVSVYRGAGGSQELGKCNAAVEALAQALRAEKLTIVALGPATNIATLLMLYPELASQIEQIILCAGRTPGQHFRPGHHNINVCDCNFEKDTKAFKEVLSAKVEVVLSGYEPASYVYLSKEDLQPLKNSSSEKDHWVYQQLREWQLLWKMVLGSQQGFIPFDAVTMGYLIAPGHLQCHQDMPVKIQTLRNDARLFSRRRNKPYLLASYDFDTTQKVNYCYQALPALKKLILNLLTEDKHVYTKE